MLADAAESGLIDFAKPVALLLLGVVHFIADADQPVDLLRRTRTP